MIGFGSVLRIGYAGSDVFAMESEVNSDVFARPLPPPSSATATTTATSSSITSASSTSTSSACASSTSSTVASSSCASSLLVGRLQLLNATGQIKQDVPLNTKANLEKVSFVVGRTKGVALCIPHVQVSRKHAQIDYDVRNQKWSLLDTGSSNGVFVDGRQLEKGERITINRDSVITLGPTEDFRLKLVTISRSDSDNVSSPAKRRRTAVSFGMESELQFVAGVREANNGPSVQVEVRSGVATASVENSSSVTKTTSNESIDDDTATAKINFNGAGLANKENNGAFDFLRPDVSMDRRRSNQFMPTTTRSSAVSASTVSTVTTLAAAASCPLLGHGGAEDPSYEADNAAAMAIILNTPFGHEDDFNRGEMEKVDASDNEHKPGKDAEGGTEPVVDSASETLASKMKSKISTELSCTICNEIFIKPMSLPCGHVFCSFCLSQWKKKSSNTQFVCPNCRYKVGREKINHNIYIDNLIESLVKEIGGDLQRSFQEAVASREEEEEKERQAEEEKKKASKSRSSRGRPRGSTSRASTSTRTAATVSTTTARSRSMATSTLSGRSVGHATSHVGTIRNYMVGGTVVNLAASTSSSGNRGRGSTNRSRTSRNSAVSTPTARPVDVITLSEDNNNEEEEEEDDNDDDDEDEDEEDDSDSEEDSDSDYAEGDPDATYGGYGRCFSCGRQGHWYGGCPFV